MGQPLYDLALLHAEAVGVGRVDGGEVALAHGVALAADGADALVVVDLVEQEAVVHPVLGVAAYDLGLELKLEHAHGLVHLGYEAAGLVAAGDIVLELRAELLAGVVLVYLHGKDGQVQEVDAVAVFEHREVSVAHAQAQHIGHAGAVACGGTYPQHVVVAKLHVEVLVLAQGIHHEVRARAAVEEVAHDMQAVYRQALYEVADGHDEVVGLACADDGFDDALDVAVLVGHAGGLVEQLLDDVGELLGQLLAHLGAGILGRDVLTHRDEAAQGEGIPVVHVVTLHLGLEQLQLLGRVVDEGAEGAYLLVAQLVAQHLAYLALDIARRILEHMLEGLVLAVYVGQEVLGALGQAQDGLEVDDLGAGLGSVAEAAREQLQVVEILLYFFGGIFLLCHKWHVVLQNYGKMIEKTN